MGDEEGGVGVGDGGVMWRGGVGEIAGLPGL